MVVPVWALVAFSSALVLLPILTYRLGVIRGSSLSVRLIGAIAVLATAYPPLIIVIDFFLQIKLPEPGWQSIFVPCLAIVGLTVIDIFRIRPEGSKGGLLTNENSASGATLLTRILDEWIDAVASADAKNFKLRRSILMAIGRKEYAQDDIAGSSLISWPANYWFKKSKRYVLIGQLRLAFYAHGARMLPSVKSEFQNVSESLAGIISGGSNG
jgi:hypothetical protein